MENIHGLTTEEVKKRIEEGKINSSNTDNLKSNWEIIRDNVCTLFNLFNLIIAVALACVHAYTNMVFILIIIVNVLIGIIQEIHGKNLVKKLSILTTAKSKVIRDGKEQEIKINEIVLDEELTAIATQYMDESFGNAFGNPTSWYKYIENIFIYSAPNDNYTATIFVSSDCQDADTIGNALMMNFDEVTINYVMVVDDAGNLLFDRNNPLA